MHPATLSIPPVSPRRTSLSAQAVDPYHHATDSASLFQVVRHLSLNQPILSKSCISAKLLAQSSPLPLPLYQHTQTSTQSFSTPACIRSCLVTTEDAGPSLNGTLTCLRRYPSAHTLSSFYLPGYVRTLAYSDNDGLLIAAASPSASSFESTLSIVQMTHGHTFRKSGSVIRLDGSAVVHSLAVTAGDTVAVAYKKKLSVFAVESRRAHMTEIYTVETPNGDALCTKFAPNGSLLAFITEDGYARLVDTRGRQDCSQSFRVCPPVCDHTRVNVHVSTGSRDLYIATEQGLTAWDLRMCRDVSPNRTFEGLGNPETEWFYHTPHNRIFDVEEGASGGLLAATGQHGDVLLWDCYRGGPPLRSVHVGEPALRVQFASWHSTCNGPPGLWVQGVDNLYTLRTDDPRPDCS